MRVENKTVNALWIGKSLSLSEVLTMKSFVDNGHEFVLWAYDEIETPIPEGVKLMDACGIIPRADVFCYNYANQFGHGKGSYAGFSDIFRYKLLYLKGGWWTDMDVTCLKPLDFKEKYVFRTHHSLPLVGNIMKSPIGSELMKKCYDEAYLNVDANNRDWHLPIQILVDNVLDFGLDKYIKEFSNEDSWNLIRKLLKSDFKIPETWYVIHWVNEEWRRNGISKYKFLRKSLFYKLLKKHNVEVSTARGVSAIKILFKLTKISFGLNYYKSKVQK